LREINNIFCPECKTTKFEHNAAIIALLTEMAMVMYILLMALAAVAVAVVAMSRQQLIQKSPMGK
jgi:hypothetical protein